MLGVQPLTATQDTCTLVSRYTRPVVLDTQDQLFVDVLQGLLEKGAGNVSLQT